MVYFLLSFSFIALQIARERTTVVGGGRSLKFLSRYDRDGTRGVEGEGEEGECGGKNRKG